MPSHLVNTFAGEACFDWERGLPACAEERRGDALQGHRVLGRPSAQVSDGAAGPQPGQEGRVLALHGERHDGASRPWCPHHCTERCGTLAREHKHVGPLQNGDCCTPCGCMLRQPHACRPVSTAHVLTMSVRLMIVAGQVVRSSLVNDKGKEVVMFWYLESVELPQKPGSMFGACTALLRHCPLRTLLHTHQQHLPLSHCNKRSHFNACRQERAAADIPGPEESDAGDHEWEPVPAGELWDVLGASESLGTNLHARPVLIRADGVAGVPSST